MQTCRAVSTGLAPAFCPHRAALPPAIGMQARRCAAASAATQRSATPTASRRSSAAAATVSEWNEHADMQCMRFHWTGCCLRLSGQLFTCGWHTSTGCRLRVQRDQRNRDFADMLQVERVRLRRRYEWPARLLHDRWVQSFRAAGRCGIVLDTWVPCRVRRPNGAIPCGATSTHYFARCLP